MNDIQLPPDSENPIVMIRSLTFLLALACGAIVANLYYAQTLITSIGSDLHLNLKLSVFIVTLTQFGLWRNVFRIRKGRALYPSPMKMRYLDECYGFKSKFCYPRRSRRSSFKSRFLMRTLPGLESLIKILISN